MIRVLYFEISVVLLQNADLKHSALKFWRSEAVAQMDPVKSKGIVKNSQTSHENTFTGVSFQ